VPIVAISAWFFYTISFMEVAIEVTYVTITFLNSIKAHSSLLGGGTSIMIVENRVK